MFTESKMQRRSHATASAVIFTMTQTKSHISNACYSTEADVRTIIGIIFSASRFAGSRFTKHLSPTGCNVGHFVANVGHYHGDCGGASTPSRPSVRRQCSFAATYIWKVRSTFHSR
jgi:hypothetical protein